MDQILSLALLFSFLGIGFLAFRLRWAPKLSTIDHLAKWTLWVLLSSMGLRLSQSRELSARLPELGLLSVSFAAASVLGTVLVLLALFPLLGRLSGSRRERGIPAGTGEGIPERASDLQTGGPRPRFDLWNHLKGPLKLLAIVLLSFVAGLLLPPIPFLSGGRLTTWALYALLALIGAQMAANEVKLLGSLVNPATVFVPLGTIAGTFAASLAVGWAFSLPAGKSLALGAGFGWYSLSGVLISDMGDPLLGSAAFLSNMFRETIALVAIPFLSGFGRGELAIGAAGATSMDVTLPLIERCAGPRSVPLSIAHGLILSLLVPVLVPIVYRF